MSRTGCEVERVPGPKGRPPGICARRNGGYCLLRAIGPNTHTPMLTCKKDTGRSGFGTAEVNPLDEFAFACNAGEILIDRLYRPRT